MALTSLDILICYELGLTLEFLDRKGDVITIQKDKDPKLCPGILNRICKQPQRWSTSCKNKRSVLNRYTFRHDESGIMEQTTWVSLKWEAFKKETHKVTLIKIEKKLVDYHDVR